MQQKPLLFTICLFLFHINSIAQDCPPSDFPTANFSATANCFSYTFVATTGTNYAYSWDFGDGSSDTGQTVTHDYNTLGGNSYTITLTVTNTMNATCVDTHTETINFPAPIFQLPATGLANCQGGNFTPVVSDNSTIAGIANYTIIWGDGKPDYNSSAAPNAQTHDYTTSGILTLQYIVTTNLGCTYTTNYAVTNVTNPAVGTSNPGNTAGCSPNLICFPINDTESNDPATIYEVDFGDGSELGTYQHNELPTEICHTYELSSCKDFSSSTGYAFTITAITGECIPSIATVEPIIIYEPPTAQFEYKEPICVGANTSFINTTILGYNARCEDVTDFIWNFGDNSGDMPVFNTSNQSHTYTAAGNYTVTLIADNAICEESIFTQTICVSEEQVAVFNALPEQICTGQSLSLNSSSVPTNCAYTDCQWSISPNSGWDLADGESLTDCMIQPTFSRARTYTISLTGICGAPVTQTIEVVAAPMLTLRPTPNDICNAEELTFTASIDQSYNQIDWIIRQNGVPIATESNIETISYTFTDIGSYEVEVSISSDCGTDMALVPFNFLDIMGETYDDLSLCSSDDRLNLNDQFGLNGGRWTGTGITNNRFFDPDGLEGSYDLVYTVSASNCPIENYVTIQVTPTPTPLLDLEEVEVCLNTQNTYTLPTANITGDWTDETGMAISNMIPLTETGAYPFTYTSSINGCTASATFILQVYALTVDFMNSPTSVCNNSSSIQLEAAPNGGMWSGDQVSTTGIFESNTAIIGDNLIFYTYADENACTVTDTLTITVTAATVLLISADPTTICQNNGSILLSTNTDGGTWDHAAIEANVFYPDRLTPVNTTTDLTLTYRVGGESCQLQESIQITILPAPIVHAGADQTICANEGNTLLIDFPNVMPINEGIWEGAGIVNASTGEFDPNMTGTGTFPIVLSHTNVEGCIDADTVLIAVAGIFTAPLLLSADTTMICQNGAPIQLTTNMAGGTWDHPAVIDGFFYPDRIPLINTTTDVTLTYLVGDENCQLQESLSITISPVPIVHAGTDQFLCANEGNIILADFPNVMPANEGIWSGTGIVNSSTGEFNPIISEIGNFPITLSYTNAMNCTQTDTVIVTVEGITAHTFHLDSVACINTPIFLQLNAPNTRCDWYIDDVLTYTNDCDVVHEFNTPNLSTIQLITTAPSGCQDTLKQAIVIVTPPTAFFDHNIDNTQFLCEPVAITINNIQAAYEGTYHFDMGISNLDSSDIIVTNHADTSFTFTYTGDYIVSDTTFYLTLTVANPCDTVVYVDSIKISPLPKIIFGPAFDDICSGTAIPFNNVSLGNPEQFEIDWGDGTMPISTAETDTLSHTFYTDTFDTTYLVQVVASNNCGTTRTSYPISVQPNTVKAFFNIDTLSGCVPLTVQVQDLSTDGDFVRWDFDDGAVANTSSVSHTFTQAGTYTIGLYANNGCAYDSTFQTITVLPAPVFEGEIMVSNRSTCVGEPISFSVRTDTIISQYTWVMGNGDTLNATTPTYAFDQTGTYHIQVIVQATATNCPATISTTVDIQAAPIADFTKSQHDGCAPLMLSFEETTQQANYFSWDFGDGNTSNLATPTATFYTTVDTTYQITLIAQNDLGCTDTTQQTIRVYAQPTADFSLINPNFCNAPTTLYIQNQSSPDAIGHTWLIDDMVIAQTSDLEHTFNRIGDYNISLITENTFGCQDTNQQIITVFPEPTANFTIPKPEGCTPFTITLDNTTTNGTEYLWSMGNGDTIVTQDTTSFLYTYANAGQYAIHLIATTNQLCPDTLQQQNAVIVHPSPTAEFTVDPSSGCQPLHLTFKEAAQNTQSYQWDFGDGNTSPQSSPTHTYEAAGNYDVTLVVTNDTTIGFPCSDTLTLDSLITVHPVPEALFTTNIVEGCAPLAVQFFGDLATAATTWSWTFSNGEQANESNPTLLFEAGTYDVHLEVSHQELCFHDTSFTELMTVYPTPFANFSWQEHPDTNGRIQLFNESMDYVDVFWNLGDGTTNEQDSPPHQYFENGDKEVVLQVTNGTCIDDTTQIIRHKDLKNLHVPNALMPADPDPEVKVFLPKGTDLKNYEIWIYDKWGALVWHSNQLTPEGQPAEAWNGRLFNEGELLPQGVYVWKIEAIFDVINEDMWLGQLDERNYYKTVGDVHLIR